MKSGSNVTGNFRKSLAELGQRAESLGSPREVLLRELMPPSFIAGCSSFTSLEELFAGSPFETKSTADFRAIPDAEWDTFISSSTSFSSWRDMHQAAIRQWAREKLGFK